MFNFFKRKNKFKPGKQITEQILAYIRQNGNITPICLSDIERHMSGLGKWSNSYINRSCRYLRAHGYLEEPKLKKKRYANFVLA